MPVLGWEMAVIDWLQSLPWNEQLKSAILFVSKLQVAASLLGVFVIFTIFSAKSKIRGVAWAMLLLLGVFLTHLLVEDLIKILVQRPRPQFLGQSCGQSYCWGFVSGYLADFTAAAFCLVYLNKKHLGWVLPMGFLIGLSRMLKMDHYPLDVILGALVGALVAYTAVRSLHLLRAWLVKVINRRSARSMASAVVLLTASGTFLSSLPSCTTLAEMKGFKEPTVSVQGAEVSGLTAQGAQLLFNLKIDNPNNFGIKVDGLNYDVTLGGKPFTNGTINKIVNVAANGATTLQLPLDLVYQNMLGSLGGLLQQKTSPYVVKGSVKIGIFSIPFEQAGRVNLKGF